MLSPHLGDSSTVYLLVKVLCYTIFYAGLIYLPLRFAEAAMGWLHESAERRRAEERTRKPTRMPTTFVIR